MKPTVLLLTACLMAGELDSPSGHRTTPPILNVVSPTGIPRGTTTELTVEGLNLGGTRDIYFSRPGITGRILRVKELPDLPEVRLGSNGTASTIDLGPLPPRNRVTIEVDVAATTKTGPVSFRLQTPLGTTTKGRFLVEPYYGETADKEPNDSIDDAVETILPTILTGTISKPGDTDYFKVNVKAGQELVFDNQAMEIGSTLQPVLAILDPDSKVICESDTPSFAHRFEKEGTYYIRISDFENSGRNSNFYRIQLGSFPVVTSAYPLGLQRDTTRDFDLTGYRLTSHRVTLKGELTPESEDTVRLGDLKRAVGAEPEIEAQDRAAMRTEVSIPVTITGRLTDSDTYRFHARKGENFILEVNARRLGSKLDSYLEVLDANGKRIERATVRPVSETATTLSDRDSVTRGLRILSWSDWKPGDYIMMGREIVRVDTLPNGPDEDVLFDGFAGQRIDYF